VDIVARESVGDKLSRQVVVVAPRLICRSVKSEVSVPDGIDLKSGRVILGRITRIDPHTARLILGAKGKGPSDEQEQHKQTGLHVCHLYLTRNVSFNAQRVI
jgi:hypothetical protein